MWEGKKKAITFSFDDGVTQDVRMIEILDKYGLKCTFNLNSGWLGLKKELAIGGAPVTHDKLLPEQIRETYKNHEVAAHTLYHRNLTTLTEQEIIEAVEEDRKELEKLVGYPIAGMAYPCGGVNNDDRVAEVLRKYTKIRYARTITSSYNFKKQSNLLRFNPTVHFYDKEKLFALAKAFIELEPTEDSLFYVWGHSYEMDGNTVIPWEEFERFCAYISGKEDIFYGTNAQVLL